jgi:hypothetical protein
MPADVFRSEEDDDDQSLEREANPGSQRFASNSVFTKHDLQVLIQNHDRFVNPRGNENAKKIGCQRSDFQVLETLGKGAHGTALKVRSVRNG